MIVRDYQDVPKEMHPFLEGITLQRLRDLKGEKVEDLNLRIFEVQPGTVNALHTHDYSHDLFVFSGEGFVRLETSDQRIKVGDVVYIEPEESHSFGNGGDDVFRFLCIDYRTVDG